MRSILCRWLVASGALIAPVVASAQVELRGRLVSQAGDPIAGATVTLGDLGFSLKTDSAGRFVLSGAPGAVLNIRFSAAGFRPDTASVALDRRRPVVRDFTMVAIDVPLPERNPSPNVLRGTVIDESGQPLSYANVQVNYGTRYVSDDSGRFLVPYPGAGRASVFVRRIGFEPVELTLAGMPDTALRVSLKAIPMQLKEVLVTGTSAFRSLDTYGFYKRMKDAERGINHGYFITPEDIARRNPSWMTQMAEGFPTVRVQRGHPPMKDVILGSLGCKMTVYLDNVRIVGRLSGSDDYVNELALPTHVAGMEIYPRSVSAPPQYQPLNGTCGVVLLWTK